MKDEEIIKKAVDKAIWNGYLSIRQYLKNRGDYTRDKYQIDVGWGFGGSATKTKFWVQIYYYKKDEQVVVDSINFQSYNDIIFSHDFAKAFWGKDWEGHLQIMVLKEKPLNYISLFI